MAHLVFATRGQVPRMVWFAVAASVGFSLCMALDPAGPAFTRWLSDFGLVAASAASAAALFGAARRESTRDRSPWWWLGVSSLLWSGGQLSWALQQNVFGHQLPIGSFSDVGYLASSASGVYGVAKLATGSPLSKLRVALDGAIAAVAVLTVLWVFVVGPTLEFGALGTRGAVTGVAFKIADAVKIALVLSILASSHRRGRAPLIWMCGASVLHAGANAVYNSMLVEGTYQTGGLLDAAWFSAFAALMVAGRAAQVDPTAWQSDFRPQPRSVAPYLPVAIGAAATLWRNHSGGPTEPVVVDAAAVLALLITARHALALSEHRWSHQRLNESQYVGGVGSWQQDLGSGRMVWSDEMFRILGVDPVEGEPTVDEFAALLHPQDRDLVLQEVMTAVKERSTFAVDHRVSLQDGSIRWIHATGGVTGGRRPRLQGMCHDITDAKVAQLAAQQAQKLEALGRLAGGIAHDFNNLLTPIIAHAQLLSTSVEPESSAANSVAAISTAGRRGADLTQQLLDFCRAQEPTASAVDVDGVVEDVAALLSSSLPDGVALELCANGDPAVVEGDAGRLNQVILNLALNAIDAMPDGGTLRIAVDIAAAGESTPVVVGTVPSGECVRVTVSDTGTGMDGPTLRRCFEPFFTTKPPGRGTGLGLASVYGIVTQAGGAIDIVSEPGAGTAVSVLLRTATADLPQTDPVSPSSIRAGATILLVDDDEMILEVVARMLHSAGHDVLGFVDSRAALADAREMNNVDLLLTDVVMPHLGGVDLAALIRMRHPEVPVLFMSGYDEGGDALRAVATVGGAMLPKPFVASELLDAVTLALSGA